MSRADLLALTPEAVATLANVGLVKRAQKDIEAGSGPALVEETDGTVVGTFADGVVTRLVPGKTLRETPCTCNAATTCRHRVAVAIAYPAWHAARAEQPAAEVNAGAESARWSPAELDDAALEQTLGTRLARAKAAVTRGVLVTVQHAADRVVPMAKLPSCTVRFLVPRDVAYARCDCAEQGACEHLAIAVWAFRAANGVDGVVSLGGTANAGVDLAALDEARAIVRDLIAAGVAAAPISAARFARARSSTDRAGMIWISSALADLEQTVEAYASRSALYSNADVRRVVLEIESRARAVTFARAELPVRYVLGEDEAAETLLDHVRLVSLGARVRADGTVRLAELYLADPDTGMVLVLSKRWSDCADTGPALAKRAIAARITLGQLATGQLVSKAVKRRANRSVEIGTSRTNQSSVTPQHGAWESLGSPILIKDIAAHLESLRARPPWMLRPRLLAENLHVMEVNKVIQVGYSAANQSLDAIVTDHAGATIRATVAHRAVAPHAIDAAAAAFSSPIRFISGELTREGTELVLDVVAIAGDSMVVPDIAAPTAAPSVDKTSVRRTTDAATAAESHANGVLEELMVTGLGGAASGAVARIGAVATELRDAGLASTASRLTALADAARSRDRHGGARAWLDAAVRLSILADVE